MSDLHHSCDPVARLEQQTRESDMFWNNLPDELPQELRDLAAAQEDINDALAKLKRVRGAFMKATEMALARGDTPLVTVGLATIEALNTAIVVLEKKL